MKRFEMWKWFKLPVECNLSSFEDDSDLIGIYEHDILSSHHVEKVEIAINSYDQHVDLIAKQAEQIKMLREALSECIKCSDSLEYESGWMDSGIEAAEKALSATEQK